MSEGTITAILVVVAILVLIAGAVWAVVGCSSASDRSDRVVDAHDSRLAAEGELVGREQRYRRLDIHPLPPEKRELYQYEWRTVQNEFVDEPGRAVRDADRLG